MLRPYKRNQAADSERKTRWKRGPVNCTPTSFSPADWESHTWTTRPWVAKSDSLFLAPAKRSTFLAPLKRFSFGGPPGRWNWARREPYCVKGMRISRSEPMATSKRVTKAAPLRQRFSLEVSSSKANPWASRPRTFSGSRTAILRSERCFVTVVLASGTMGRVLDSGDSDWVGVNDSAGRDWVAINFSRDHSSSPFEETLDTFEDLRGRARRMYKATKLAAVSHAMSEPASELLHFANAIGQVGSINLPIVVH